MPRKNVSDRSWIGPHHVYNRAANGRSVFRSDADRQELLDILASRLTRSKFRDKRFRNAASHLHAEVSSFCLMTTHFHLIVWQSESEALRRLVQSVLSSYVRFYNAKYGLQGPLFAGPFRSRPLKGAKDFRWTTAYVHANHPSGPGYRFSSHQMWIDDTKCPGWMRTFAAIEKFNGIESYAKFMDDHSARARLNNLFF